jgi:hypothetical protein
MVRDTHKVSTNRKSGTGFQLLLHRGPSLAAAVGLLSKINLSETCSPSLMQLQHFITENYSDFRALPTAL